jgi:peptide/nickel transport system permease protein
MTNYVLKRLRQGAISVLILLIGVFFLTRVTGNPLDLLVPMDASPETRDRIAQQLGLDQPMLMQFLHYLRDLGTGDLGTSFRYRQPVWELFKDAFPVSMQLAIPAAVATMGLGLPLGVLAASSKRASVRKAITVFSLVGMASPLFWTGILLIFVFSVHLGVLPSARTGGFTHYILPVTTITVFLMAGLLRLTRSSMLEAMDSEYVRLARLEGMPERIVVWKHAFRNSLTASVAYLGVLLSLLVTGATVVESVFAWPGIGRLTYEAVVSRDYPLIQGIVLITSILIILVSLAVDIAQAYLDPRIRL